MSGIYGMVRLDDAPVTSEMLQPVGAAMAAWGPDGHGLWSHENAGLGFLSLHVTPESAYERMPASLRAAPHLFITADARIDNRDELFTRLDVPAAGRARTPDSSLILLAYERWGADCVTRLLGDFTFAIWDSRERRLFCGRDPLGCRPFYYFSDSRTFLFASDIKGILAGVSRPRLNEPLLAVHLQMRTYYAQKSRTFYENILKLPAGHILTVYGGSSRLHEYWSPLSVRTRARPGDGELRDLFRQAVECRLRSAFPIAAHLSGGIDSSAITLQSARLLRARGRQPATFSWSPSPADGAPRTNEYARIDAVCQQENLRCEYLPVTAASLLRVMERDFTVEPAELLPREENVQIRAQALGIRTILSGWGGDEGVTHWWKRERRMRLRESLLSRIPDALYSRVRPNSLRYATPCVNPEFAARYRHNVAELQGPPLRRMHDLRGTILRLLEIGHLSLRMEDWAVSGARRRIVYGFPLLDRRLVEFALGTPLKTPPRYQFVASLSDLLPPEIDWRTEDTEPATLAALSKEHIAAHLEWASRDRPLPAIARRLVDPDRIRRAIETAGRSGTLHVLQGVKESIGCYAIQGGG
ncbi:MAG TPA: asparagine synthase-related protein [Bryobacteraceae bacterium]|nr:asparagine synthase-related protein [Bryobacteraceae bacterium]